MRLIRLLKKDLAHEARDWLEKGIITRDQATAICAEYDIDLDSDSRQSGYRLLTTLGYLFIGLAVITLIGANWEQIPRGIRMGGLMMTTGIVHLLAIRSYRNNESATGLYLLANILFGASIILIAQIYNLGEHMPDAILLWALGSLPIGLLTKNPILTLFSCILGLIWFWVEFGLGYYPWLFPVFIVAGLWTLITGRTSLSLFLTVAASITIWVESLINREARWFEVDNEHLVIAASLAIFAYALSHWLVEQRSAKTSDYGTVLSIWSLRLGLLMMFIMSFSEPWHDVLHESWSYLPSMVTLYLLLMAGTLWLAWQSNRLVLFAGIVALASTVLVGVINFPAQLGEVQLQVVCNLCLIATGILLIIRGTRSDTSHYFFLGVVTILATAFLRYMDLIGDYVGGALLFAVIAAVLLAAARFWEHRESQP